MLIVALVLAVIGLAALVTAVVTSNELIAWVCIGASVIGVLLLIVDAVRERSRGTTASDGSAESGDTGQTSEVTEVLEAQDYPDYPDDPADDTTDDTTDDTVTVATETADDAKRD